MEVIIPNPSLPSKAGKAKIHFTHENISRPKRDKEDIILPLSKAGELYPLAQGTQFIFTQSGQGINREIFFGGTDEEPFLVQLSPNIFSALREEKFFDGNQRSLYNALKPAGITKREILFKTDCGRQGDIFFVPLEITFDALETMFCALYPDPEDKRFDPITTNAMSVFGTRHELHGTYLNVPNVGLFAEGILKAPDHAERTLLGVHFLAQTVHLFDPSKAD
jgi:hypothetical protein